MLFSYVSMETLIAAGALGHRMYSTYNKLV